MQSHETSPTGVELRRNRFLFLLLVGLLCAWVLSLPMFPTQDGPAHKFYGSVLAHEIFDHVQNPAYHVRLPVPPYAAHDYFLAFGSRVISLDLAEKLFICIIIVATAAGVRLCCGSMGGTGPWASLFIVPLLFHWSLAMGFLNYAFGLALMLLCFHFWLRAQSGKRFWWMGFLLLLPVLTLTHPVPLLMLFILCAYDLATAVSVRKPPLSWRSGTAIEDIVALGCLGCALAYPVFYTDAERSSREVQRSFFQLHTYINELLLTGLSPFYRHAAVFSPVTLYRAMIWCILAGALVLGARGLRTRWRSRALTRPDCMLLAAVALFLIIPLMPDSINGALDFFIRMLPMVWVLTLFAAGQALSTPRMRRLLSVLAIACTAIALVPAELSMRSLARELAATEQLRLPPQRHALLLSLADPESSAQGRSHMTFDPYLWSGLVPMLHAHDIVMNSPWIDSNYLPLAPGPDPKMLYNILSSRREREDIDQHDGDLSHFPIAEQQTALHNADFILAVRGKSGQSDLFSQLGLLARNYRCEPAGIYLLCTAY